MPDRLNILIFFPHFPFRDFGAKILSHDSFTNFQNIKSSYRERGKERESVVVLSYCLYKIIYKQK